MNRILVKHSYDKINAKGEGSGNFLLTNKGGYFYFNPGTKYRGLHFPEKKDKDNWTLFKTIDLIKVNKDVLEVSNNFNNVSQKYDTGTVKYFFNEGSFVIEADIKGELTIVLDMREIFDYSDVGRIYEINEEKGCILIEYKKYNDNVLEKLSYTRFLAIKTDMAHENIKQWTEQYFKDDEDRKSQPYRSYSYEAFKFKCNRKSIIGIGFSADKHEALIQARKAQEKQPVKFSFQSIKGNDEEKIAFNCAVKAVKDLYVELGENFGLYAGLPWFFQFWTRDESISTKALIELGDYELTKKILRHRINFVKDDGRIPNRIPISELASADGTGWVFMRLHELMLSLKKEKKLDKFFPEKDLSEIRNLLNKAIEGHKKNYSENDLIKNIINETWMDTNYKEDVRDGFRIEVQALWMRMIKFHNFLDTLLHNEPELNDYEHTVAERVKEKFWKGDKLLDGVGDEKVRPNVFLAFYVYPELLSKEEWEKAFDYCLSKLWLDWGGLSSIDKSSPLFCPKYTGEDTISYHRGDSWYFVNNIAAICLNKINKQKYEKTVEKIKSASTNDILYKGMIAGSSEISSASEQRGDGSKFQLWSAATYIELIKNV